MAAAAQMRESVEGGTRVRIDPDARTPEQTALVAALRRYERSRSALKGPDLSPLAGEIGSRLDPAARGASRPRMLFTFSERKKQDRAKVREERLNKPPTWRSSLTRAGIGASMMFLVLLFIGPKKDRLPTAILFTVFALLLYAPAGYYIELFLWRRRQRKKGVG